MKPKTKSDSAIANVSHSVLFTLFLGVSGLLVLPSAAVATPNLFVCTTFADAVTVVDPNTFATTSILVGDNPIRIAMTPDGSRAFVANTAGDTVSVINTQNKTVIGTISVGHGPQELTVSPDGTRLYVVHQADNFVAVIDATNGDLVAEVTIDGTEAKDVLVSPDNAFVYVANYNNASVAT